MSQALAKTDDVSAAIERVLVDGDLNALSPLQRVQYYRQVCESLGLNYLTKPFEYLRLNNKLVLYATRACGEQLRLRHKISTTILSREVVDGIYVVTTGAKTPEGREDSSIGAVPIEGLKGEAKANAMMKAETKSKRRVTFSICGLGMLDESEVESIPKAQRVQYDQATGEVKPSLTEHDDKEPKRFEALKGLIAVSDTLQTLKDAWSQANADHKQGRITAQTLDLLKSYKDDQKARITAKTSAAPAASPPHPPPGDTSLEPRRGAEDPPGPPSGVD